MSYIRQGVVALVFKHFMFFKIDILSIVSFAHNHLI